MAVSLTINVQTVTVDPGPTLFDYAEQMGLHVPSSCHKQGKCRECLMEITQGMDALSPPAEEEKHLKGLFRLSCRSRIVANTGTICATTMRRAGMSIEDEAMNLPCVTKENSFDPAVKRDGDFICMDGREIGRSTGPIYGLAMDLGTTTVVVRLVNLETGGIVAKASFENPQRFGGSDVMARIQYDTEHPGRLLQRTLGGYLSRAIRDFPVDPGDIYEMVVAGNPTMRDIFFGLSVYSIGQKPYRSQTEHEFLGQKRQSTSLVCLAKHLHLPTHPDARVYGLPVVSGHVGADAAACLLAIDMAHEERLVALMDIGTNTELFVGNRHRLLAASCPAGPAFEGRAIKCGMAGLDGAIEKVRIEDSGRIVTRVIGGKKPQGICGSGLIDLLGELRRVEFMNECGRFEDPDTPVVVDEENGIVFNEGDVNELAQAKGANVAGLRIVTRRYGCTFQDLDAFYIAGGFGRHLDIAAARRIGLVPDLPDEKIVQVGNASLEGATIALLSAKKRRELEDLVKTVRHVELETDPSFFDHFVSGCQFSPLRNHSPIS